MTKERLMMSEAAPRDEYRSWIYGTHLVPLMACVVETSGPILELGCGRWSTAVLRAYCLSSKREFVSVDTSRDWAERIGQSLGMMIGEVDIEALASRRDWSVVLIDHDPWFTRVADAVRFAHGSEFVLVHDSQYADIQPQLLDAIKNWQYAYEYTALNPGTMILSNTKRIPII